MILYKKHFITSLKLIILLMIISILLGVVIGGFLIQIGYDPNRVYLLGTPKGIIKFFAEPESERTFYEVSDAIRANPDLLKNILVKQNFTQNRTFLFYDGLRIFLHNIGILNRFVLFYLMFAWKKYFFLIFPQQYKIEKGALLILLLVPIVLTVFMWISLGCVLIPIFMHATQWYMLSWPIGLLHTLVSLGLHGFFEDMPFVIILTMTLMLYYIASNILDKASTCTHEETNIQIYGTIRRFILSRFAVNCIVLAYLALFLAGQIEAKFSCKVADYLFWSYFPIQH